MNRRILRSTRREELGRRLAGRQQPAWHFGPKPPRPTSIDSQQLVNRMRRQVLSAAK